MRRHPYTRDQLRMFLARTSFVRLVGLFVAIYLGIGVVTGAVLAALLPAHDFSHWARSAETELLMQNGPFTTGPDAPAAEEFAGYFLGFAQLLLPALVLGVIVFKLLLARSIFVFRRNIALLPTPDDHDVLEPGRYFLAVRYYSASPLDITDLQCRVLTQNMRFNPTSGDVIRIRPLMVANPTFPYCRTHMPHTLQLQLEPDDVTVQADGSLVLNSVQGYDIGEQDRLIVLIQGRMPELGTDFIETHEYQTRTAVAPEPFGQIEPNLRQLASKWKGWEGFE